MVEAPANHRRAKVRHPKPQDVMGGECHCTRHSASWGWPMSTWGLPSLHITIHVNTRSPYRQVASTLARGSSSQRSQRVDWALVSICLPVCSVCSVCFRPSQGHRGSIVLGLAAVLCLSMPVPVCACLCLKAHAPPALHCIALDCKHACPWAPVVCREW